MCRKGLVALVLAMAMAMAAVGPVSAGTAGTMRPNQGECFGQTPTVLGTDASDDLSGTPGADVIQGLAGDDHIDGLGGDDLICGGSGRDVIEGGAGSDNTDGGEGVDTCAAAEYRVDCDLSGSWLSEADVSDTTGIAWTSRAEAGGTGPFDYPGDEVYGEIFTDPALRASGRFSRYVVTAFVGFPTASDAASTLSAMMGQDPVPSAETVDISGADQAIYALDEIGARGVVFQADRVVGFVGSTSAEVSRDETISLAATMVTRLQSGGLRPGGTGIRPRSAPSNDVRLNGGAGPARGGFGASPLHGPYSHELDLDKIQIGADDGDGFLRGDGDIWIGVNAMEWCATPPAVVADVAFGEYSMAPNSAVAVNSQLFAHVGERPHPTNAVAVRVKDNDEGDILDLSTGIIDILLGLSDLPAKLAKWLGLAKFGMEALGAGASKVPQTFKDVGDLRGDLLGEGETKITWPHGSGTMGVTMSMGPAGDVVADLGGKYSETEQHGMQPCDPIA